MLCQEEWTDLIEHHMLLTLQSIQVEAYGVRRRFKGSMVLNAVFSRTTDKISLTHNLVFLTIFFNSKASQGCFLA